MIKPSVFIFDHRELKCTAYTRCNYEMGHFAVIQGHRTDTDIAETIAHTLQ